jgi:hypothetical protein
LRTTPTLRGIRSKSEDFCAGQNLWEGQLLGHKKLDTTALYTRVALKALGEVTSPLERLVTRMRPPT